MNEESLFAAALELPPEGRAAFLDRACASRPELRASVESLLAAHELTGLIIDRPQAVPLPLDVSIEPTVQDQARSCGDPAGTTCEHVPSSTGSSNPSISTAEYRSTSEPGIVIAGRYTLQEKIGEGGMGEVWVARQTEPVKRRVALKLIKMGMDSRAVIARFEQERQALAMMDHPNIARVLDGGLTPTGQPFFVMELVNGLPLTKFCDEARLTPRARLELFVPICQAVQHAHQKGIVHRDLKPANILITLIDGRPVPKVIDFGVAKATAGKLTEESMSTQFGAVVGTLEYMSPEQAGFSGTDIDTRADVYSLGVILYELLTGLRPIDSRLLKKAALTEMIRIIREDEPSKPSTRLSTDESLPSLAALRHTEPRKLMAMLRGELDWVVMKCLEKARERRYETANALARDVQRYLADEAVEARPPSAGYRLQKFVKRNRGQVLAVSFVFLALLAGLIGTAWGLVLADRALVAEAAQRKKAEESEAVSKAQRARAESREQQAIDAVKKFRDAVADNPELKNNPALEPLRTTLLKEPLAFFKSLRDRLQADRDTRPESLIRLARASYELGYLTGEIGDKQDALIAHREAMAIWQRLADANPAVADFQNEVAVSHDSLANLLSATGQKGEALEAYKAARTIQQRLVAAYPAVANFRRDLAGSHHSLSLLLKETGQPAEALQANKASLLIRQKLADDNPSAIKFQADLATSHSLLGTLLSATGQPGQALEAYQAALTIQQKLADANPAVIQIQGDLARTQSNLGVLLCETGQMGEALKAFKAALLIRRKLVDDNPAVTKFQSDLASSQFNLANLQKDAGRPGEALDSFKEALLIRQKLADANPAVTQFQSDLATSHSSIGNLLRESERPGEALDSFKAAIKIQQKLVDANPAVTDFQNGLARSHHSLGLLLRDTNRPGEAIKAYKAARTIQQKLADANPAVIQFQADLARSHHSLGFVLNATGQKGEALEAYKAARTIQQKLANDNPAVTQFQADLALTYYRLGLLLSASSQQGEALESFKASLLIRRKLADANPAIVQFQADLARSHHNLGLLQSTTGQQGEALEEYKAALTIQQKLVAANPSAIQFRVELARTHNNLGNLLNATGQPDEALEAYLASLAIGQKLAKDHPDLPDLASGVGGLLNYLALFDINAGRFNEARDRIREAIDWQRKALAINPANPTYRKYLSNHWTNLRRAALALGDAQGAAEAERGLVQLRESDPTMIALDTRLATILQGDQQPRDNSDRLRLAQRAYDKAFHVGAAKLWGEAIEAEPKVAEDRRIQIRYNAACAAALAGSGQGKDEPAPDDPAKAKLREQARAWLQAELAVWMKFVESGQPQAKEIVVNTLIHWKEDADLAGVREANALETLPEAEREPWRTLWSSVDALLTRTQAAPDQTNGK